MKISIIIPAFNEELTLERVISNVKRVKLTGVSKEIIVIDDGSTDNTGKILGKIKGIRKFKNIKNKGKGYSVIKGIAKSTGNAVLIQDADLEYEPKYIPLLIKKFKTNQQSAIFGSRLKNYPLKIFGTNRTPFISHYIGNKFLSFVTSILYGSKITDMETGYKIFPAEIIKKMKINSKGFDFEPEVTSKFLKKGYKIIEVPIKIKPRGYNEGKKITWKDGFSALKTLIKYRFSD